MGNTNRNGVLNSPRTNTDKSSRSSNSMKRERKALSGQPKPTGLSNTKRYASKKLRAAVAKRQKRLANQV